MKLGLIYCYENATAWGQEFLCKLQATVHKTKPFIAGKRIFVGKVVAGVVGRIYVNQVDFVFVYWQ